MPIESSVISVISLAVEADPSNVGLRLHLASLLLDSSQVNSALEHCMVVLARQPDNVEALRIATKAAEEIGETDRAQRYAKLVNALEPSVKPEPEPIENGRAEREHGEPVGKTALRLVASGGEDIEIEAVEPTITLADVAGMEDAKRRLNLAFLAPLRNPEMMKAYGKTLSGGLMLYGPPGCGKTFIARAVAGELGAKFVSVGLSDVLDMWMGSSERNLHEIFESARRESPSVIFFDEIDALGRKRSLVRHSPQHNVINVLLSEMDGMSRNNKGVFVLAATNHPWDVDSALRRPGRFDRTVIVLPPDKDARLAMIHRSLSGKPSQDIDLKWLVDRSDEFSGADLVHLCDSAAELAMEESLEKGTAIPISPAHFKKALSEIRPSTRPWFEMARNYAMFANEGGVYDELLRYMRLRKIL